MRTDCNTIRRELDEANLDDRLTIEVNEHLSNCDQCRRFHDDRRTLRSLMAGLETVGAPADFDFRLRARLARDRPRNGFRGLLLTARPLAAVALVVLMALVAVVVKTWRSSTGNPTIVSRATPGPNGAAANEVGSPTSSAVVPSSKASSTQNLATGNDQPAKRTPARQQRNGGAARNTVAQKNPNRSPGSVPRFNTRESAGTGAEMITPLEGLVVVPVDAHGFKLSIDNVRGVARTISLPPVTFGSQRLLAREASFVPVSAASRNW